MSHLENLGIKYGVFCLKLFYLVQMHTIANLDTSCSSGVAKEANQWFADAYTLLCN